MPQRPCCASRSRPVLSPRPGTTPGAGREDWRHHRHRRSGRLMCRGQFNLCIGVFRFLPCILGRTSPWLRVPAARILVVFPGMFRGLRVGATFPSVIRSFRWSRSASPSAPFSACSSGCRQNQSCAAIGPGSVDQVLLVVHEQQAVRVVRHVLQSKSSLPTGVFTNSLSLRAPGVL